MAGRPGVDIMRMGGMEGGGQRGKERERESCGVVF
jgi:hypothetical protein